MTSVTGVENDYNSPLELRNVTSIPNSVLLVGKAFFKVYCKNRLKIVFP